MKTVLVQVAQSYLCLTACEPAKEQDTKDKKAVSDVKMPYSFTPPMLVEIEPEDLGDRNSIWEDPKLFASLIKNGLEQMNSNEVEDVVLMVESFDLTCHEYQHIKSSQKILNSYAIEQIKEFVGEGVNDFSVIYKDFSTSKETAEISAKAFAFPKRFIFEFGEALKQHSLNLLKVVPTEVGMMYAAKNSVYSFDKTVGFISMDYSSVRIFIARNSNLLYCHEFHSPVEDVLKLIAKDREISLSAALDYLRTVGYGFQNECRLPETEKRLIEIRENVIDEIIRNLRLVLMSLNINLDQLYLSDFIAYIPHMQNYISSMGLCSNISLISDSFTASTIAPEPTIQARDNFYKSGAFYSFNEIMNSGNQFQDNLLYGVKAAAAKNINFGKKAATIGSIALCGVIVVFSGVYGFFAIRGAIDTGNIANPKYDTAKKLIANTEKINTNIENQSKDAELLPRTQFYTDDIITQLNSQVVLKISKFGSYNISHSVTGTTEKFTIPISGTVGTFDNFIDLQNSIKEEGFFVMNPTFTIAESAESGGYVFQTELTATQTEADRAAQAAEKAAN